MGAGCYLELLQGADPVCVCVAGMGGMGVGGGGGGVVVVEREVRAPSLGFRSPEERAGPAGWPGLRWAGL